MTVESLPWVIRFELECYGARDLFWSVGKEIWIIVQRMLDVVAEKFGLNRQASVY